MVRFFPLGDPKPMALLWTVWGLLYIRAHTPIMDCFNHSLVLDLEVQVPSEPVIEEGLFNITGGQDLQRKILHQI